MEHAISLLIVALTALAVYAIIKSGPRARAKPPVFPASPYQPQMPAGEAALHWSDGGRYLVEVVNESKYQPTLKELAGAHGDQAAAAPYLATLVPDDANPYESAAVIVFLGGRMVGQLAPKAALLFRQRLASKEIEGKATTCDAMVRGGGVWQNSHLAYVAVLDLEPFE